MQAEERIWRETEGGNKTMKPIIQGHTRRNKERKKKGTGRWRKEAKAERGLEGESQRETEGEDRETEMVTDNSAPGMSTVSVPAGTFLSSTSKSPARQRDGVQLKV